MTEENKAISTIKWIGSNIAWECIKPILSIVFSIFGINIDRLELPMSSSELINFGFFFLVIYGLLGVVADGVKIYRKIKLKNEKIEKIFDRSYNGKTIKLDKKEYRNCEFNNCTFRWCGGKYFLDNCVIGGYIGFETPEIIISNTIRILRALHLLDKKFADSWKSKPKEYFND